jgi:tyrosine decarboxylase/aspartate 1-decarboxylase
MYWPKLTNDSIKKQVFDALRTNANYRNATVLGVPASYLDNEIFYDDAPFLTNAPYLSALIANPNHIGCHTLGESEMLFAGTQELERELIKLCAEQIFKGEANAHDGYVAPGGTEANIQAAWIYRNYFMVEQHAQISEIGLIFSKDSHYSMSKAANLLNLQAFPIEVGFDDREMNLQHLEKQLEIASLKGIRFFIINLNMGTTMFGSVDAIEKIIAFLKRKNIIYKLHIDAAFGGFIYPFSCPDHGMSFKNPYIDSITIDAHKMLQTPYGTGIFLVRKGYLNYVCNTQAKYVVGNDHTLCGSRSGANAIAVWMVLHTYGSDAWKTKINALVDRTTELCDMLRHKEIKFFRNPHMNIIAIKANHVSANTAKKYFLVADSYENPQWWKIVMMPHITRGMLDSFINDVTK